MLTDYIDSLFGEDNHVKDERDAATLVSPRGVAEDEGLHAFQESIDMSDLLSSVQDMPDSTCSGKFNYTLGFRGSIQSRMAALSDSVHSLPLRDDIRDSGLFGDSFLSQEELAEELENSGLLGGPPAQRHKPLRRRLKYKVIVRTPVASPQSDTDDSSPKSQGTNSLRSSDLRWPGSDRKDVGDLRKGRRTYHTTNRQETLTTDSTASMKGHSGETPESTPISTTQLSACNSELIERLHCHGVPDITELQYQRIRVERSELLTAATNECHLLMQEICQLLDAFDLEAADLRLQQQKARKSISSLLQEEVARGQTKSQTVQTKLDMMGKPRLWEL